jgi:arabinofuranosyltransferase
VPIKWGERTPAVLVTSGVLLLLLGALLAEQFRVVVHDRGTTVDDGFIVFRYAENLVAGHGFRWNATGTPCEGFSSTAALIGVAGLMRVGVDPVMAAVVLNLAGAVALIAGLLAASGLGTWTAPVTCLPILYLIVDGNFAVHASRGLETAFFAGMTVLFILMAGHIVRKDVSRRSGFVRLALASLLLGLCRPEAPLVIGACWFVAAIVLWRRGEPLREMLPGIGVTLAGVVAYVTWRVWYFGAPLPTPYYVKANLPSWLGVHQAIAFAIEYRGLLIPAFAASVACWALLLHRTAVARTPPLEALAVMVIGPPWLLYSARILHEVDYNHRLSYPLVAIAALGLVSGLRFLLVRMFPQPGRVLQMGVIALPLLGLAAALPQIQAARYQLRQPEPVDPYVVSFIKVGRAIGSVGLGDSITFVTPVAGAMPYFSRARHIDPFGLASDELSRRRPREERQRFMKQLQWDVATYTVPPATPGATSAANDPLFQTPYFANFVVPSEKWVAQFDVLPDPSISWTEYHHSDMRKLRDTATLVGMIPPPVSLDPPRTWRHYLYVNRATPHHDALVRALRGAVVQAVPVAAPAPDPAVVAGNPAVHQGASRRGVSRRQNLTKRAGSIRTSSEIHLQKPGT